MTRKRKLTHFETLAQRVVEGSFKRLFGEQLEPYDIAARLARVMEDSQAEGLAAVNYSVFFNPGDLDVLNENYPDLNIKLVEYLIKLARQAGVILPRRPQVEFFADSLLQPHSLRTTAEHRQLLEEETTRVHPREVIKEQTVKALRAVDAYLIVNGRLHFPLDRPLITLGRRIDNDIVLDSATISRHHAQIRWRYGRFILYDLSQRGRTAVNGQTVTVHALQPGDVIALSDTLIIYGEGREDRANIVDAEHDGQTKQLPKLDV